MWTTPTFVAPKAFVQDDSLYLFTMSALPSARSRSPQWLFKLGTSQTFSREDMSSNLPEATNFANVEVESNGRELHNEEEAAE